MVSIALSARLDLVFSQVERSEFMRETDRHWADVDAPFPIGFAQTISQPTTVRHMLTWLDPQPGEKILDVGSGSGWTAALLSELVGDSGHIFSTERIAELKCFGEQNCTRLGYTNVTFHLTKSTLGLAEHAPFDRILVSAAAKDKIPRVLIEQLAPDGKLVVPVDNCIIEIKKNSVGNIDYCHEHQGYVFVPLLFTKSAAIES